MLYQYITTVTLLLVRTNSLTEKDTEYWYKEGTEELKQALNVKLNTGIAKNIILFLGDGMGVSTLTATRILKGQKQGKCGEEGWLEFEKFPHVAAIKTYNVDTQVSDSASTATAYLCGVKTNTGMIGVSAGASFNNCESSLGSDKQLTCIADWAIEAGKHVGFVTTARVTHATPGAMYAGSANRDWECDSLMEPPNNRCKDIARQLVEDYPGNRFRVILGGGRQMMQANPTTTKDDPIRKSNCRRDDNKDLVREWYNNKIDQEASAQYVETTQQLLDVDTQNVDYLMGLFSNGHVPYEKFRDRGPDGSPSIANMTLTAIKMLEKSRDGYFLLVEGARIDHGHHDNLAHLALDEGLRFEEAVITALDNTDPSDTLILVTADHSHTMTIAGYPKRGNPILGFAEISDIDNLPYTTLSYANGVSFNYTVKDGQAVRVNLTNVDTEDPHYKQLSAVPRSDQTHGGEDVLIYAKGPMAHLFHSLHEQSYIAHAMGYAACIGPVVDISECRSRSSKQDDHFYQPYPIPSEESQNPRDPLRNSRTYNRERDQNQRNTQESGRDQTRAHNQGGFNQEEKYTQGRRNYNQDRGYKQDTRYNQDREGHSQGSEGRYNQDRGGHNQESEERYNHNSERRYNQGVYNQDRGGYNQDSGLKYNQGSGGRYEQGMYNQDGGGYNQGSEERYDQGVYNQDRGGYNQDSDKKYYQSSEKRYNQGSEEKYNQDRSVQYEGTGGYNQAGRRYPEGQNPPTDKTKPTKIQTSNTQNQHGLYNQERQDRQRNPGTGSQNRPLAPIPVLKPYNESLMTGSPYQQRQSLQGKQPVIINQKRPNYVVNQKRQQN